MAREKTTLSSAFAMILQQRRELKKISRQALAERAGLHQTAVGLIERGMRTPTLDTAHLLAQALEVDLAVLIREAEALQRQWVRQNK